ncbi:MAG: response regulator transcription factor [Clostridiaceae bacterium]
MGKKVLICDDDNDILKSMELLLKSEGFDVVTAKDGLEALEKVSFDQPELIILDIMMPRMDGISALMRIREEHHIPVIMLSAKGEIEDKVIGLNAGADDYMTKPFSSFELMARVKSHLRRSTDFQKTETNPDRFETGGLVVDDTRKEVTVDGRTVNLTPNEYGILTLLIRNKGMVFTSNQIYEKVWQEEAFDIKKIVSLHVSHIREKIEIDPRNPDYLISIYGMGYKVEDKK